MAMRFNIRIETPYCDLQKHNIICSEDHLTLLNEIQEKLKNFERTRYLVFWYDGSSVLKQG